MKGGVDRISKEGTLVLKEDWEVAREEEISGWATK